MHESFNESDIHGGLPDLCKSIAICTAIGVLFGLLGCSDAPSADIKARAAELSSGFKKHAEVIGAKQDEALTILREQSTVMAAIKAKVDAIQVVSPVANGKESDPESSIEPQGLERDSQITPSITVSAPAVRLQFYTQDFCRDCTIQHPKAEAAAEELGISLEVFDLKKHDDAFEQAKITVTPTTVIVIDDAIRVRFVGIVSAAIIVERAKSELSGTNAVVSRPQITNPVVSHGDLVSIHNRLHGGGNWTWPGDLETHLRQSHGYGTKFQPVQLVSRGTSCPNDNCPTPRSVRMRWSR